jgi:transposase
LEVGLKPEQRAAVQAVSIDMWPVFAAAITAQLQQALIAYNPFHVVSHMNAPVDAVRRAEHRRQKRTQCCPNRSSPR